MLPRSFAVLAAALTLAAPAFGQEDKRFYAHITIKDTKVAALALHGEGKYGVLGFSHGAVTIFAIKPGRFVQLEPFPAHTKAVTALAFGDQNHWLASAGADGSVKVWQVSTIAKYQEDSQGRQEGTPKLPYPAPEKRLTHAGGVNDVAFSPDGKALATAGNDGAVKVWTVETGKLSLSVAAHKGAVHALAYSPDGKLILTGGADKAVRLWKAADGTRHPLTIDETDGPVRAVAFAPDGKRFAAGGGAAKQPAQIRVWDAGTGKEEMAFGELDDVTTTLQFHPNLPRLVSGGRDKKLRTWDLEAKKPLFADEHAEALIKVTLSADGKLMFSVCSAEPKLWNGSPKVK